MKKFVFILLALFIAVPMVSNAGSMTSRWDVTFGGFVKADFGWANRGIMADSATAPRESITGNQNVLYEYPSYYSAAGETRFNFLIKGPDAGKAKTMAFIEGDFAGATAGNYNSLRLRHAFMKFDWGNMDIIVGQTWFDIGTMFMDALGRNEFTVFNRGDRQPQIRFTHRFARDWTYFVGIYSNTAVAGTGNTTPTDYNRSGVPNVFGEFAYASEACGKIGADKLMFGIGGLYGLQKLTSEDVSNTRYNDDNVNVWVATLRGYIPILPEKAGNKTNALFLKGHALYGQNYGVLNPNVVGAYKADTTLVTANNQNSSAVAPKAWMGYAQLGWWATNNLNFNAIWGYFKNQVSDVYKDRSILATSPSVATAIDNQTHFTFSVLYDVNQAVRLGGEYSHINTTYVSTGLGVAAGTGADRKSVV